MSELTPDNVESTSAGADGNPGPESAASRAPSAGQSAPATVPGSSAAQEDASAHPSPVVSGRARRLMKLPVSVVVYLAEKRIEVKQLLSISPGALITFNKPCEDLLDLYVNNHRYCRGEAVKIGEKFGIKISEVGVVDVRESPILV